jgi:hypothetical protein
MGSTTISCRNNMIFHPLAYLVVFPLGDQVQVIYSDDFDKISNIR